MQFGGIQVDVLAPFSNYLPGPVPSNNDSMVLRVAYGATSVLLEGDAEAPLEDGMVAQSMLPGRSLQSTLLKVGHHGSRTSTRPEFLASVAPQWAVISCGIRNRYHHPRSEVLQALESAHVRTYLTELSGASCFLLNGSSTVADPECGRSP
jgi:competence protein ComEC